MAGGTGEPEVGARTSEDRAAAVTAAQPAGAATPRPFALLRRELSTLRSRIALFVSVVFLVVAGGSAYLVDSYASARFKQTVIAAQGALLNAQADAIASKLRVAIEILEQTARKLPPGALDAPDRAQAFVDGEPELRAIFTNGLFLITLDGRIVGESPPVPGGQGRVASIAAKLPSPADSAGSYIMEPFASSVRGHDQPNLSIGAWVRDAHGKPIGRLHGGTFLLGENWLADVSRLRIGQTGYLSIVTRSGIILTHRDPARILGPVAPRGANPLLDRALVGFEGSGETVNSYGVATLTSYKRVPGTAWILIAVYPLAEAYAPLEQVHRTIAFTLAGASAVILLVTWAISFRTLGPLSRLSRAITAMALEGGEPTAVAVAGSEEVGRLGGAFNELVGALAARRESERASQEKFFAAFHHSVDYMVITRLSDGVFLDANAAVERIIGWRPEELIGRSALAIGWWADPAQRAEVIGRIVADGTLDDFPIQVRTKSGRLRDCRLTSARLDLQGETCSISVVRDVTEALSAERRIAELSREREASLQRLRGITDNLPVSIMYADRERRIRFINRTGALWFARPAAEIIGRTADELLGQRWAESTRDEVALVLDGKPSGTEQTIAYPDGKTRTIELSYVPEKDAAGEVQGYYALVADVTERKATDEQLRQSQRMEAVGQLTGGVAHDFSNLLAVISGNLEILEEALAARDDRRAMVETALRATRRGTALARSLLAFARKQPLAPSAVELNVLVRDLTELLRRTGPANVEIEVIAGAGTWLCEVDPGQLQNALLNLVANARDAMPEGGRLTIETGNARLDEEYAAEQGDVAPGQYVMLAVSDTGTGMPPEIAARAFEPFLTTKEVGKGTGLGLSMVYGFVKQSRGHVRIYSEVGRGTTVRLYLRRIGAGVPRRSEAPEPATLEGRGETVLVVEDDPDLRFVARRMLGSAGYQVLDAADAHAALEQLRAAPRVALLLTDVVLSKGISGPQLAAQAGALYPGLPVLYMSGYTESAIPGQAGLDPGAALLQKPFSKPELLRKVRAALDAAASAPRRQPQQTEA